MRALRFGLLAGAAAGGALWFSRPEDDTWAGHTPSDTSVERVAPSLYTATSSIFGIKRLRRMTVCVLKDDGLLVFSPICLPEEKMDQLFRGQTVRFVVAPNGWHRLDTALYKQRFPQAMVLAPERSRQRVAEKVAVDDSLEHYFGSAEAALGVGVIAVPFRESSAIQECVLNVPLKSARRVLLVGDVFQNASVEASSALMRPLLRLYGAMGRDNRQLQMSRGFRFLMAQADRATFLTSLAQLCRGDPSIAHIVMCHGEPVDASPAQFESLLQRTN
jgi:hypothetical protein